MFQKTIVAATLMAASLMLSASASAQVYAGASVGEAKWNADCAGTVSCTNNDTAYKIFGGYSFGPRWDAEVSYFSVGTAKASFSGVSVDMKGTGFDIAAVYKVPLSKDWTVFGRMGVAEVKGQADAAMGAFSGSVTTNSAQPVVGFGVIYNVTQNFDIRADIDSRKVKVVSGSGGSGNVTNFTIGGQVSF
ncbi:MAG: outer membrane beta-barrel protein [Burkholderiales bacterium]